MKPRYTNQDLHNVNELLQIWRANRDNAVKMVLQLLREKQIIQESIKNGNST